MEKEQLTEEVHKKLWEALHHFNAKEFAPVADGIATFFLAFHEINDISADQFEKLLEALSLTYQRFQEKEDEK